MKLTSFYKKLSKIDKKDFIVQIGKKCKIANSTIKNYVYGVKPVSGKHCKIISELTAGHVSLRDMRPDIF